MVQMESDGPSPHSPSLHLGLPAPQPSRGHHAQSLLGPSFHDPRTHIFGIIYIYPRHPTYPPKWQKNNLVSGGHGKAGNWRGQWTGWIGSTPVQISGCGLDGALSWCGQGQGQSFWCQVGLPVQSLPRCRFRRALRAFIRKFCMRVCISVYMCMCADMIYVYICMCGCICASMRLYKCACVCVCIFVHRLWVLVSVLQRVNGAMHAHVFSCAYACVYICV